MEKKRLRINIITWLAIFFVSIASPTFSFASDESNLTNTETGSDSSNINDLEKDVSFNFSLKNDASIDTHIELNLDTGNNDISDNTVVGDFTTGNVETETTIENTVESPDISLPENNQQTEVILINETTGPDSENINKVEIKNNTDINIRNECKFDSDLDHKLNTGGDSIDGNAITGDIRTGDIEASLHLNQVCQVAMITPEIPPVVPPIVPPVITPEIVPEITPTVTPPSITLAIEIPLGAGAPEEEVVPPAAGAGEFISAVEEQEIPVGKGGFIPAGAQTPYSTYMLIFAFSLLIGFATKDNLEKLLIPVNK